MARLSVAKDWETDYILIAVRIEFFCVFRITQSRILKHQETAYGYIFAVCLTQ